MGTTFQTAQPYVTGAVHFFIGREPSTQTPNAQTKSKKFGPEYMGTCEFSPRVQLDRQWIPLFNDLGGPVVPFDRSWAGQQAFIAADFTRWNDPVIHRFDSAPSADVDLAFGLWNEVTEMGSLVNTEGLNLTVWVVFPYQSFPAYNTMVEGYRFLSVVGLQTDMNRMGTQPRRVHLNMHATPMFDPKDKSFTLCDHDMNAVQGLFPAK